MSDKKLMAEFEAWLKEKNGSKEAAQTDDDLVEIVNGDKRAKVRRCDAAPWLKEHFGIDIDDNDDADDFEDEDDENELVERRSRGSQRQHRNRAENEDE